MVVDRKYANKHLFQDKILRISLLRETRTSRPPTDGQLDSIGLLVEVLYIMNSCQQFSKILTMSSC
jgi:hypothetical protein